MPGISSASSALGTGYGLSPLGVYTSPLAARADARHGSLAVRLEVCMQRFGVALGNCVVYCATVAAADASAHTDSHHTTVSAIWASVMGHYENLDGWRGPRATAAGRRWPPCRALLHDRLPRLDLLLGVHAQASRGICITQRTFWRRALSSPLTNLNCSDAVSIPVNSSTSRPPMTLRSDDGGLRDHQPALGCALSIVNGCSRLWDGANGSAASQWCIDNPALSNMSGRRVS